MVEVSLVVFLMIVVVFSFSYSFFKPQNPEKKNPVMCKNGVQN